MPDLPNLRCFLQLLLTISSIQLSESKGIAMALPQLSHETLRYGTHSLQTISIATGPNNSPNGLWVVYVPLHVPLSDQPCPAFHKAIKSHRIQAHPWRCLARSTSNRCLLPSPRRIHSTLLALLHNRHQHGSANRRFRLDQLQTQPTS